MQPGSLALGQALVLSRTVEGAPDPVGLFTSLTGERRDTLLLESADHRAASHDPKSRGQRSLLITRAALRLTSRDGSLSVEALSLNGQSILPRIVEALEARGAAISDEDATRVAARFASADVTSETERLRAASVLDAVRASVLGLEVLGDPVMPPLCAGSFAYDLLATFEALPPPRADALGWPDFELWLAEEAAVVEHASRRVSLLRYVFGGEHSEVAYHDAARAIGARLDEVRALTVSSSATPPPIPPHQVDIDDERFEEVVRTLKEHIRCGDVFQIVPSRTFSAPCKKPIDAYARLRALNPSPYMFFIRGSAGTLFGASPESALTVRAEGHHKRVAISPLAGTRARGRHANGEVDEDLDARIEAELRLDAKEVAEHMMLVDLARNDIARVSRAGSRRVDRLLDVVRYSHVMHLESLVSGVLKDDLDALHAYVATMNMGTLVGAPKLRAAELLRHHEADRRGPYGGAVGYLTSRGDFDTCIVIRSAVVQGDVAHVRAGCGVVFDSDPAAEALETRRKAAAVLAALGVSA